MNIIRMTPPGRSAIASLRVEGKNLAEIFEWLSVKSPPSRNPSQNTPIYTRLPLEISDASEEVVLHLLDENRLEIHSHGGEAVVSAIVQTLKNKFQAVELPWSEWVLKHSESKQSQQMQVALSMIPFAKTERIAKILLDQYHGALDRELATIRNSSPEEAKRRLARLQENGKLGRRILTPFQIVLFGPVNSGKSSLLNALVGFQRVVVHHDAGTTRDAVHVESVIDGWPVLLIDTAGIRQTDHELEQEGIKRSWESVLDADLVLNLIDLSSPTKATERGGIKLDHPEILDVVTKCDLSEVQAEANLYPDAVKVSAKTGEGIETLLQRIAGRLVPHPPEIGEAVPLAQIDPVPFSV
ncbi:MAG: 50S ribosome-binding GTPase [Planctomycetaceae bacterium]|nr:50S ribosome-binding GTPase [Planctomycetaceae bacterium]